LCLPRPRPSPLKGSAGSFGQPGCCEGMKLRHLKLRHVKFRYPSDTSYPVPP
jgi:hypothetical protein